MSSWVWIFAVVAVVVAVCLLFGLKARSTVARKVAIGGRRVLRIRGKWLRSPFARGLTPFALVYRVTTQSDDEGAKAVIKLYAYDCGRWFSRYEHEVRQFSGGVWRNA